MFVIKAKEVKIPKEVNGAIARVVRLCRCFFGVSLYHIPSNAWGNSNIPKYPHKKAFGWAKCISR